MGNDRQKETSQELKAFIVLCNLDSLHHQSLLIVVQVGCASVICVAIFITYNFRISRKLYALRR